MINAEEIRLRIPLPEPAGGGAHDPGLPRLRIRPVACGALAMGQGASRCPVGVRPFSAGVLDLLRRSSVPELMGRPLRPAGRALER